MEKNITKIIDDSRHPLAYVVLLLLAVSVSLVCVYFGPLGAIVLVSLFAGIPLAYAMIVFPRFGIITLLVSAYLIMWLAKADTAIPFGTLMDGFELLLIAGFFIHHKSDRTWNFAENRISWLILAWLTYNLLEVFNPEAESRLAWLYTIRSVALVGVAYFVFSFHIRTVTFIRLVLKIWLALSLFAALYAFKQEFFGFFPFERKWLADDPVNSSLWFIGGHWRKFSIFSDPVALAYNMVISSLLCLSLLFGNARPVKKIVLGVLAVCFMLAMLYTGTRGAFVLIPAGLVLLFVLKCNRKNLMVAIAAGVFILALIKTPTGNPTLDRFQSAFRPDNDASYNVRKVNQKRIQPYIQSHPIGGGLGSTGTWGQRFSPNSYLASFPPDSGYVRVAVENGWVGLLLICGLFFTVLLTGINNYFRIRDPELRNYCLAMTVIVFALAVGNFPQEALVQFPINIYFYLALSVIGLTLKIDRDNIKYDQNSKLLNHSLN